MDYEVAIGLEVHAQLATESKMFCSCSADYRDAPPNTHVCPVCLGMPGSLPVINKKAVEYTIMTAMALNSTISRYTKFDRKNYCYPDLMKGYQISQYDAPIGMGGWVNIDGDDGTKKRINLTRVHLEEDVAKLWHGEGYSLVDVNRAGIPLMEMVSEPEISSPEDARDYLVKLRNIVRYLGVSTGNMEEGSFRCDANISVRPRGCKKLFPKSELKNLNSFKAVYQALQYEAQRQVGVLEEGGKLVQETRGWLEEKGRTVGQRSKEDADDYRYFPEPDLPPLMLDEKWLDDIRSHLPELPEARRDRFMNQFGLSLYDASVLTGSKTLADYFDECLKLTDKGKAKELSNWILGDFSRLLNLDGIDIADARVRPRHLLGLLDLLDNGVIGGPAAKVVLEEMFRSGQEARDIVEQKKLSQLSDEAQLLDVVTQVIANNPSVVADYKSGKHQALKFMTGQVMKATRGRANPAVVQEILAREMEGE
ncbi:MAG: Asp-tRNA(Asn)/Glu-tRNA(Gln) amidotransferase subunit GatB [Dehalococcoidia bacterium]|nr:Asp-tRNA(Asn)/Glu-tRNA(Gln) amidotransferase subunit GatB [Dehalococcoidia bacterium]